MIKYAALLLSLASQFTYAELIEKDDSDYWTVDGLAHYVRSRENDDFTANLIATNQNRSTVGFTHPYHYCSSDGDKKKVKIHYQWVRFVSRCSAGTAYWVPESQKGTDFLKQHFSSNADVKVLFDNVKYTFSTKYFVGVKQQWENTVDTLGNAI